MAGSDGAEPSLLDDDTEILSVTELNDRISSVVTFADSLQDLLVTGEVVDCNRSQQATYFSLTDGDCTVKCFMWNDKADALDFDVDDGLEVLLAGDVDFYTGRGRLNVKPWLVRPVGDGERAAALERLRAELEDRGWFAPETKRPLPTYPATVGIVTSARGDAPHDIQDAIHGRYPDVDVVIEHASVQGENAPSALAEGVACLDADPTVDVIIVGRGGGSDSDLMAFNSELLAEAIFHADTPVVAAVGHRADETIADAVADESAITPTAAGERVVRKKQHVLDEVAVHRERLEDTYANLVTDRLADLDASLDTTYDEHTRELRDDLENRLEHAYDHAAQHGIADLRHHLESAYADIEHEHEKAEAVTAAKREAAGVPTVYKVAIVVLVLLLALTIAALILT